MSQYVSTQVGSKKPIELPQQNGDLEEYIIFQQKLLEAINLNINRQTLQEFQNQCQSQRKYIEAETAKKRIAELKLTLTSSRMVDLREKHTDEKMKIEKAHLDEFNEFNSYWDQQMIKFDEDASQIEQQMIDRHQNELVLFEQELENQLPNKQKTSAELLNLRKIEENLAKQKEYVEAHKVMQQCEALEKNDYEKFQFTRKQKIRNQVVQLKTKQDNELNALRQRIISGQDEQRKVRSMELERLLQKYQNVKKELELQQLSEQNTLEKTIANPGMNNSRYQSKYQSNSSKMLNSSKNFHSRR